MAILSLIESGELTELFNKWWFENTECDPTEKQETSRNELSLKNVAGIFFILIGGLILSLVVALFEFLLNKRNEKFVQHHQTHTLHHNHQHHHQQASQTSQQMQTHPQHMQHNTEALKAKLTMQPGCEYDNNGTTVSTNCKSNKIFEWVGKFVKFLEEGGGGGGNEANCTKIIIS